MSPRLTFVSGAPRTGTTLAARIFGALGATDLFLQPLPLLHAELKRRYLLSIGAPDWQLETPFADQSFHTSYPIEGFGNYLSQTVLTVPMLRSCLLEMQAYSGQYFKPKAPFASLEGWQEGTLIDFLRHYFETHRSKRHTEQFLWKETFCEECIPYLLEHGVDVVQVIRDPRDSITSQIAGDFADHTGVPRPLLYQARQWRKSAAYQLNLATHPQVRNLRYEDLVHDPETKATVAASDLARHRNSSFGAPERSTDSIGRHREHLPDTHREFIEALCYFEMKLLGYSTDVEPTEVRQILDRGIEGDYLSRENLQHYAYSKARQAEELARYASIVSRRPKFEVRMHLFERCYERLREVGAP